MKEFNIGIVGLGRVARRYIDAIHLLEMANIRGLYSRDENKTSKFIDENKLNNTISYRSYQEMVNDDHLDVVIICTPDHAHFDYAIQAIEHKKHVFIEKPVCTTLKEAELLLEAEKKSNTTIGVGYHLRWHPGLRKIFEIVDSPHFGSIHHLDIHWAHTFINEAKWRLSPKESKWWSLSTLGTHSLDIARRVMTKQCGEIVESKCVMSNAKFGGNDESALLTLRFSSGATASIYSSILYHSEFKIDIYGDANRLHGKDLTTSSRKGCLILNNEEVKYGSVVNLYVSELMNFIGSIKGSEKIEVSLEEAVNNIKSFL